MSDLIVKPARYVQVLLLFPVGEDPRSDQDLANDARRCVSVTLSARGCVEATAVLNEQAGRAQLEMLTRMAGQPPAGVVVQ